MKINNKLNLKERVKRYLWSKKYRRASRSIPRYHYTDFSEDIEGTFELFFEKCILWVQSLFTDFQLRNEEELSIKQIDIIIHALGLHKSDESYRNYYHAPKGTTNREACDELCLEGYLKKTESDGMFMVTEKGKEFALEYKKGDDEE